MARSYRIILSPVLMATRLLFGVGLPQIQPVICQRPRRLQVLEPRQATRLCLVPTDRRPTVRGSNAPLHHLQVARNRRNTPTSGSQRGTNRPRTRRDRQGMHVLRTR